MKCQVYGPPGRLEFQYPIPTPLRYPKPGRSNPIVNVYVSDVSPSSDGRSNLLQVWSLAVFRLCQSVVRCAYSSLKIHTGLRFLKTFGRPRAQKQMLLTRLLLYGSDLYSNHGILTLSLPSTFIPRLSGPFLLRRQGEDHLRSDLGLPDRGQPHMGEPTPELHTGFSLRHCRNSILQGKCTNSKTSI